MAKEKKPKTEKKEAEVAVASNQIDGTRGRVFYGYVTKKFPRRVVIEFQRTVYVTKYERFYKKKTRLHARLPDAIANEINIGDYVKVRECRPLSKIIHFIVIEKLKSAEMSIKEAGK